MKAILYKKVAYIYDIKVLKKFKINYLGDSLINRNYFLFFKFKKRLVYTSSYKKVAYYHSNRNKI